MHACKTIKTERKIKRGGSWKVDEKEEGKGDRRRWSEIRTVEFNGNDYCFGKHSHEHFIPQQRRYRSSNSPWFHNRRSWRRPWSMLAKATEVSSWIKLLNWKSSIDLISPEQGRVRWRFVIAADLDGRAGGSRLHGKEKERRPLVRRMLVLF